MNAVHEMLQVLSGLVCVLLFASAIGYILHRRVKEGPSRAVVDNLNARIRAWWVIILVTGGALLAGDRTFLVLFGFISFACLREFITVTPTRRSDHTALFASFFMVLPVQYGLIGFQWYGLFAIFIPVYSFLILPILAVLSGDAKNFLTRTSQTQWGLMVCVYCISHVPALLTLNIPGFEGKTPLLVVFLIVVVQSSDVLQYVFGKLFGRHKIAPAVSPSKTVEGLVGGVLSATLLGAALWRFTPFQFWQAGAMAFIITLMGFLGGLVMSAIKRDRNVKDWGNLVEGHGGMLDRLDSVCFSAPIFFHLTRYFFTV